MGVQTPYTGALDPASVVESIESGSAFDPSLPSRYSRLVSSPATFEAPFELGTWPARSRPGAPRWAAPSATAAAIGLRQILCIALAAAYQRHVEMSIYTYRLTVDHPRRRASPCPVRRAARLSGHPPLPPDLLRGARPGLSQLRAAYGQQASTILGNCSVHVYARSEDLATAEHVSERIGPAEEIIPTVTQTQSAHGGSVTRGQLRRFRPPLTPAPVPHLAGPPGRRVPPCLPAGAARPYGLAGPSRPRTARTAPCTRAHVPRVPPSLSPTPQPPRDTSSPE